MTEDEAFNELEQRSKKKEQEMYRPLDTMIGLDDVYSQTTASDIERQLWNEHQAKVENARLKANSKQVGGDHYKRMGVQTWDVVDTWPRDQRIGYYRGNALKYIMRLGNKDEEIQEAGKGIHYLEKLVEVLKEKL